MNKQTLFSVKFGVTFAVLLFATRAGADLAQEKGGQEALPDAKGHSQQPIHSINESMDPTQKASYENLRRLCHSQRQEPPIWVKEYFDAQVQVRLERARRDYEQSGVWFYCKYANTDCGASIWWDEVATARTWSELKTFLGGYEKLPHYSPENRHKAIEFWQSWQNKKDHRFYNPYLEDPQNPGTYRNADGYNLSQYRKSGGRRVNQKYVPGNLKALGAKPLYETLATQEAVTDNQIPVKKLEAIIRRGDTGNAGCQMLHFITQKIDAGQTDLIPDYERLMALLLRQFNSKTGMLGVAPETNVNSYGISANNVKGFARFVGYNGLKNYPYRHQLADALADQVGKTRITPAGAVRNYAYLMTLCLQQSDSREKDLFREIAEIVEVLSNSNPSQDDYKWMALSTASTWLNWGIAPDEAFDDPSAAQCQNGVTRPNRSVVGPFGRWVNIIPKAEEEIYGHPEFSWKQYDLRERNRQHERKKIVGVVPTVSKHKSPWRWTAEQPNKNWNRSDFNDTQWKQGKPELRDGQDTVWMRYDFELADTQIDSPYIKAQWNGTFDIYLNGVRVQRVDGESSQYCGLHVPKVAGVTLRIGRNVIAVRAGNPTEKIMISAGLIDWRLPNTEKSRTKRSTATR